MQKLLNLIHNSYFLRIRYYVNLSKLYASNGNVFVINSLRWPPCVSLENDSDNESEQAKHTSENHNNKHAHESSWGLGVEKNSA